MPYKSFWRDFADGFLSAADRFSVMRYEHSRIDPRKWDDFKVSTSPGIRAVQSYSLRDAHALGDKNFVPDSKSVKAARKELGAEYGFGSDGFLFGQGIGTFTTMISLGLVPVGFYMFSGWEKAREKRVRNYFEKLQQEIDAV